MSHMSRILPQPAVQTVEDVVFELEAAGRTLAALPARGCRPAGFGSGWPAVVHEYVEAQDDAPLRAPVPTARAIDHLDVVMSWAALIQRPVVRRIVFTRSLIHPVTDRHLYSWRRIGRLIGADHRSVQLWHGQGVAAILAALTAR